MSHPTGRRVTFTNGFAVGGHYFNFSTSGQWLWDELQIVLPTGQNPYPIIDALQKKVLEVTSDSAHQAELEWKGAAQLRDMKKLSTTPFISIKPVAGGTGNSRAVYYACQRALGKCAPSYTMRLSICSGLLGSHRNPFLMRRNAP